jgi:hypothetical protein
MKTYSMLNYAPRSDVWGSGDTVIYNHRYNLWLRVLIREVPMVLTSLSVDFKTDEDVNMRVAEASPWSE